MNSVASAALILDHLTVVQDQQIILDALSCTIHKGSLVAVVGPNGAGKTTLLETILSFRKKGSGTITIFGKDHTKQRKLCSYIPQRNAIDWDFPLSVMDVVIMGTYGKLGWFRRPGPDEYSAACTALEQVGMLEHKHSPLRKLSGGQQQRVFIARALVQDALLYFLDEPFVGIDNVTELLIVQKLKQLRDLGKTIIVVHHDLNTVAHYFDYVLLLNKKCIAYGPIDEVLKPNYVCDAFENRSIMTHTFG